MRRKWNKNNGNVNVSRDANSNRRIIFVPIISRSQERQKASILPLFSFSGNIAIMSADVNVNVNVLPDDVLEMILSHLDFKSLLRCELTCRRWKQVIADRRIFRGLSRRLLSESRPPPFKGFASSGGGGSSSSSSSSSKGVKRTLKHSQVGTLGGRTKPVKKWGGRGGKGKKRKSQHRNG